MAEFALIGSRDIAELQDTQTIPLKALSYFRRIAQRIAEGGHVLRTGGAKGADTLAVQMALTKQGQVQLYLPNEKDAREWLIRLNREKKTDLVSVVVFQPEKYPQALASVQKYHPSYEAIIKSRYATFTTQAHARNALIIGGFDGIAPVRAVIAVSNPKRPAGGGTGQGIRIAKFTDIPVFDLAYQEDIEALTQAVNEDGLLSETYCPLHYKTNLRYVDDNALALQAQQQISREFRVFEEQFLGQGSSRIEEYNQWLGGLPAAKRTRFENLWGIIMAEKQKAPMGMSVWSNWIKRLNIKVVT